jgi:DNA-binding response OmpR family regulator
MAAVRALIVDDDATFASAVQIELLREGDIQVDAAVSFAAAAALLDNLSYDVVVLDLDLGPRESSGIGILSALREQPRKAPDVLVISAHLPQYVHEMLAFYPMVAATLNKPVEASAVATIVRQIAGRAADRAAI